MSKGTVTPGFSAEEAARRCLPIQRLLMEVFLQALVHGILLGGFYSLMGMGQNIIFGVMNIVNFCHGEMLMVCMYITYVLYTYFGVDPYVALPIVAVLMFGLGSIPGAFFAGIFLGLLEQMSALFISPSYSDMIVFVTFIIILVVRQVMILRRR